jgi:hypothetical protein
MTSGSASMKAQVSPEWGAPADTTREATGRDYPDQVCLNVVAVVGRAPTLLLMDAHTHFEN